jgi:hypothetical protein
LDDLMVTDREWFEERPGARHRCRWINAAELIGLGDVAGRKLSSKSVIHVAQIEPGVRTRALYVPGDDVVPSGTIGFFGHRSTFELLGTRNEPLPQTMRGVLPATDLEVQLFELPPNADPATFKPEADGLVVLLPGNAMPVRFTT